MGLFGNENKQQQKAAKEEEQINKFMKKYNLDDIDPSDLAVVRRIANDLAGNGMFKLSMALSFSKAEEQAKVTYLSALVEQNWLIINQLSRLNTSIEKLLNK